MSTARNGRTEAVVAYVRAHPGCTAPTIEAALGIKCNSGLLSYCLSTGRIFRCGRRRWFAFYATEEEASRNAPRHEAEIARHLAEVKAARDQRAQLRKRGRRHASGARPRNTRPVEQVVHVAPEVRLAGDVKITVAKAPPGRFEVERAPSVFGRIGQYEKTGSAVERQYERKA